MNKQFPNGFESWQETHYEVCTFIGIHLNRWDGALIETVIQQFHYDMGTGGMYDLAEEWADEFENMNIGREWGGQFFDEIEQFLHNKNNAL